MRKSINEIKRWILGHELSVGSMRDDWRNIGNDMRKVMGLLPKPGIEVGKIIYCGETGKQLHVLYESTPEDVKLQVEWMARVSDRIYEIMERKGMTTKQLGEKMDVEEEELRSLICAQNDFTLSSLAILSVALGENLIEITSEGNGHEETQS